MAASDSSFDVVSKVDMQEVRNAVDQAEREVETRFDLKNTNSTIELDDKAGTIQLASDTEATLASVVDVLQTKLHRRGIDIRALELGDVEEASKGTVRQKTTLRQGVDSDTAKQIVKIIKEMKLKVQAAVQGDQVRVSGKSRDDLQAVIARLKAEDLSVPLQFINYR
ncbi:MAG: YajQ family cyclic di-GMP-binding protein [Armatimonadaceae bacterium]